MKIMANKIHTDFRNKDILNIGNTAELLGISTATVCNWIKSDFLPAYNNNKRWFFYKTDIEQIKSKLLNGKLERLNKRANKIRAGRTFIPKEHIKTQIHLDIFNHIIHFIQKNNIGITPALFLLALNLLKKEKMLLKVNIHNL